MLGIDARHGCFINEADEVENLWPLVKAEIARLGRVLIGPDIRMRFDNKVWVPKSRKHGYWSFTVERVLN